MNKSDLILSVASAQEISQRKAGEVVDTVISSILEGLDNDGEVTLRGFGSLQVVKAAPRTGRNIKTGEAISIPARSRVKFKSYIELV
jgi:nucleoid DNA-binding protein